MQAVADPIHPLPNPVPAFRPELELFTAQPDELQPVIYRPHPPNLMQAYKQYKDQNSDSLILMKSRSATTVGAFTILMVGMGRK